MAGAKGIFFGIKTVADKAIGTGIGDAIPDFGVWWRMTGFPGSTPMNDDLVATLNNVNVFHGFTRS
jgi:hypothetical protein